MLHQLCCIAHSLQVSNAKSAYPAGTEVFAAAEELRKQIVEMFNAATTGSGAVGATASTVP